MCETAWDRQLISALSIRDSVRSMLPHRSAMQRGNSVFTRATADSSPKRTRQEANNVCDKSRSVFVIIAIELK